MPSYEPTIEDMEIDEMLELDDALRLAEEEAERKQAKYPYKGYGFPAQEPEFDSSEEDDQESYD